MWIKINDNYLQYMKENADNRIPNQDYGENKYKPFFKLFTIGKLSYVTQINHAQPRHNRMNEMQDFHKLKHNGRLVGVVNINYMFPVLDKHITEVSETEIRKIIEGGRDLDKTDAYMQMLASEEEQIISKNIGYKAQIMYEQHLGNRLDRKLFDRCLDYSRLEQETLKYELEQSFTKEELAIHSMNGLFFVDIDQESYTLTYNDLESVPLLKEVHENGLELAKDIEITTANSKTL